MKENIHLIDKVKNIAKEIYRADDIIADKKIRDQLKLFEEQGYGKFPICIAKTQYSFSTDPTLKALQQSFTTNKRGSFIKWG